MNASNEPQDEQILQLARQVLKIEADAVCSLIQGVGAQFVCACRLCLACKGRLIVIGMGKSGHIARKIAATLASTGSPAFFVHPAEAQHGDLGMVTPDDVVIMLSNSGETGEILGLLPLFKRMGVPTIVMTGKPASTLAKHSDAVLDVSVAEEACPLNLAPTASTTATLAMGDALAVTLLEARGFTSEDFARTHPAGTLGRRLLLRVGDIMHTGQAIPRVRTGTALGDALLVMTEKGLGMTTVLDAQEALLGVFTDGDLRRALDKRVDPHATAIDEVMTTAPKHVIEDMLASEAVLLMQRHRITALLVNDGAGQLVGVVSIHDLMRAGVV
ncbi:MAG: KpsF/GutQ family sugar-phosphate isomerase [Pseudomonadota bacterium]